MANEFYDVLSSGTPVRQDQPALRVLDDFCEGIETYTGKKIRCRREGGYVTTWGQEWRIMARSASRDYEQILLRAHVPLAGFPVKLDLYEESMVECNDEQQLREELKRFLKEANVQQTIVYLQN